MADSIEYCENEAQSLPNYYAGEITNSYLCQ